MCCHIGDKVCKYTIREYNFLYFFFQNECNFTSLSHYRYGPADTGNDTSVPILTFCRLGSCDVMLMKLNPMQCIY